MPPTSRSTALIDRTLWYDGDFTVAADKILDVLSTGTPVKGIFVESITPDIKQYNQFVEGDEQITVKTEISPLTFDWNIPGEYKTLSVDDYFNQALGRECVERGWVTNTDLVHRECEAVVVRLDRVKQELELYKTLGLFDVLRVLIYVINTLQLRNVVWGVGRGSSVSSYLLYLIGVHDIDSVDYALDINDFLREDDSLGEQ